MLTLGFDRRQAHGFALLLGHFQLGGVRVRGVLVRPHRLIYMVGAKHYLPDNFPQVKTMRCTGALWHHNIL